MCVFWAGVARVGGHQGGEEKENKRGMIPKTALDLKKRSLSKSSSSKY